MENQKEDGTPRDDQKKNEMSSTAAKREETLVSSAFVSMETGEATGSCKEYVLAVVPVQVKLAE